MRLLLASLLCGVLVTGCPEASDVGYPCATDVSPDGKDLRVDAQAMDCEERFCVSGGGLEPQCSAPCGGDDDCPGATAHCREGFGCVAPVVVGVLANRKLCVCLGRLGGLQP